MPKTKVKKRLNKEILELLICKQWWHQVTVTPEDKRIKVFKKGTLIGLKLTKPSGGHHWPSSIEGLNPKW